MPKAASSRRKKKEQKVSEYNFFETLHKTMAELAEKKKEYYAKGGIDKILITVFAPVYPMAARALHEDEWYFIVKPETWAMIRKDIPVDRSEKPIWAIGFGLPIIEDDELGFEIWMEMFRKSGVEHGGVVVSCGGAGGVAGAGEGAGGGGGVEGAVGPVPSGAGEAGAGAAPVVAGVEGAVWGGGGGCQVGGGGGDCGEGEEGEG